MIGKKSQVVQFLNKYDEQTKFEIKEYKSKRGLRANAYYWALINQLADVLNIGKEELHFHMLQDYGQSTVWACGFNVNPKDFLKYYSECGESIINGIKVKKIKVYKPSSEMDSKEFSILLEGLIQECKEQGIETLDDMEIKSMLKEMGEKQGK